jgi:hypothetical protein
MINDLIGLSYEAGAKYSPGCSRIDCFALLCETRRRLGLIDYEDEFQWVYEAERLPVKAIIKAVRKIARQTNEPKDGDMAITGGGLHRLAVGVVINGGILTIAHGMKSFWTPSLLNASFYSPLE